MLSHTMQSHIQFLNHKKPTSELKLRDWFLTVCCKKSTTLNGDHQCLLSKQKDQTPRSIADLREVNKRIRQKPYPIPKIQELLQKLKGFQHVTSLDLNMGYYHIRLTPHASSICTVILPWGKYEYLRLPMGLCNSPDIFQEKMSKLMEGLEFARAYTLTIF
jgi:hypothetical protein